MVSLEEGGGSNYFVSLSIRSKMIPMLKILNLKSCYELFLLVLGALALCYKGYSYYYVDSC